MLAILSVMYNKWQKSESCYSTVLLSLATAQILTQSPLGAVFSCAERYIGKSRSRRVESSI